MAPIGQIVAALSRAEMHLLYSGNEIENFCNRGSITLEDGADLRYTDVRGMATNKP
jgi:hypothetical protein